MFVMKKVVSTFFEKSLVKQKPQTTILFVAAKKLSRGISRTAENAGVISQIRNELCASLSEVEEPSSISSQFNALETNDCTFTLPDLSTQSGKLLFSHRFQNIFLHYF